MLDPRLGRKAALAFWGAIADSLATVARLSSVEVARARALAGLWRGQEPSLVGGSGFAFINRLGLERTLAHDARVRQIHLEPNRRRKLTLGAD